MSTIANSAPIGSLRAIGSSSSISSHQNQSSSYVPAAAKGHKESVYALAMNDTGALLVSGGTEKVYMLFNKHDDISCNNFECAL